MNLDALKKEVQFRTSRSSGSGGQHVNKVDTKVELIFDVEDSEVLTDKDKALILSRLKNKISKNGYLSLTCQKWRSQVKNRKLVIEKFIQLIQEALIPPPKRKAVKPLKAKKEKRLKTKRQQSEKKAQRKKVIFQKENDLSFFDIVLKIKAAYLPTFVENLNR